MEKLGNLIYYNEESNNSIGLNEMLSYEIISDEEVWIHIEDVRYLPLTEKLRLLREGLKDLAYLVQTDLGLSKIKKISGMSWIVSKNPKLVESLGFTVVDSLEGLEDQLKEYENRKDSLVAHKYDTPGYAYIEKEKLIQLYFTKNLS